MTGQEVSERLNRYRLISLAGQRIPDRYNVFDMRPAGWRDYKGKMPCWIPVLRHITWEIDATGRDAIVAMALTKLLDEYDKLNKTYQLFRNWQPGEEDNVIGIVCQPVAILLCRFGAAILGNPQRKAWVIGR